MKINNLSNIKRLQNHDLVKAKKADPVPKEDKSVKTNIDRFEKSTPEEKGFVYNKVTIDQLKAESQKSVDQLNKMINNLL